MKRIEKLVVIFLVCFMASLVFLVKLSNASVYLDVPWIAQMDASNNLGTSWKETMNCGPTALVMAMHYLRGLGAPTNQDIKNLDDWLYDNKLISAINNYNLVKDEGTSAKDLMAAAKYYYGWWNVKHYNERNLELLHNSLLKGRPVIVGIRTKMGKAGDGSVPHFMVLIGMDENKVYVNDPGHSVSNQLHQTSYSISQFLASWATQNYCALVFTDNHQVGYYADGWHDTRVMCDQNPPSQPFVDYYLNNSTDTAKGPDFFGYPARALCINIV